MFKIRVERLIHKDINTVFDFFADYEGYTRIQGITEVEILEEGKEERCGEGALRKVSMGMNVLEERITAFERPHRICYRVEKGKPVPVHHDGGELKLKEEGGGTRVIWKTEGHCTVPLVGPLIDKIIHKQIGGLFEVAFDTIEAL